jgi:uncharacterized protein YraI
MLSGRSRSDHDKDASFVISDDNESRPPARRPRRPRQDEPASQRANRADQGDLWSDPEPESPAGSPEASDGIDSFVSDLPPPQKEAPPAPRPYPSRPVSPPPVYEDYDDYEDYEAEYSMLRNPYVLAALAVAAAIILAVVVVIAFSSRGNGDLNGVAVTVDTPTPLPGQQLPGVQVKVLAVAAIREGPGLEYFELGLLKKDQEVSVVGRTEDSSWYQVVFLGSDLKGWVPDSALRLPANSDASIDIVTFTPIPKPSVEQPTATPPPETPTEEALGPPDVAVEILGNVCPANGPLTVVLHNVGDVALNSRQVVVTVSTPDMVLSEQTLSVTLGVGQIVPISTGQAVQAPRTLVAVVFLNEPQDIDPSNNVVTCVVSQDGGGGQSGTAVPPPIEDTPTP